MDRIHSLRPPTSQEVITEMAHHYAIGKAVGPNTLSRVLSRRLGIHHDQAEEMAAEIIQGRIPEIPGARIVGRSVIAGWRATQYVEPKTGTVFMVNLPPIGFDCDGYEIYDEERETRDREAGVRKILEMRR